MGRSFWILDDINYLRLKLSFSSPKIIDPSKAILYRYNIPDIKVNDYLTPGVFIDYFLDNDNYKEIKLSILNEKGELINSFENNQDEEKIDEVTYDMQSSQFSTKNISKLTNKKGLNRFRWDLRHQGISRKDKKENIKGPLVKPGNYQLHLSLDNKVFSKNNLEVDKNPNSDVLDSKLIELEKFQLKLIKIINDAIQFADELIILSNDKKIIKKKSESLNEIIKDLVTEEGPYMQPMLIDQLKYLYNMVSRADQVLGKDAYNRFEELSNEFDRIRFNYKTNF